MADIDRIYRENYATVYKYLLFLSRNRDIAEELTQETFYRAFINLNRLHHAEYVTAWLCAIARNAFYAWSNQSKRTTPLQDDISSESDLEQAALQHDDVCRAKAVLADLEEPYRSVFQLAADGGISLKEISAIYGKSESWARVTYHRARQKIIERMENLK